ncbi:MAG: glycosyltransferase family 4 protein [Romboutsia timonensis]|uniref:glycosyltransferase family 4 protein n=1 Tax=Romboutsia timonensis TaxID=1776391 RepID=UPI002A764E74|nr:glycosyltransferase family 4 protein [Romboutsia timonensis]MDY2882894.1 glycosyltransferase family 4 protein [Romboutsia timonensis]
MDNNKKEVVIISYVDPDNIRGLQTVALNYAKLIKEIGLEVSIFTKGKGVKSIYIDGIKINTYDFEIGMNPIKECINCRKAWKKHYINKNVSVVNGHDYMGYIYIEPILNKNIKKIFTVHDPLVYHQRMIGKIPQNKKNLKYYLSNIVERRVEKISDLTYVISNYSNDRMVVKKNIDGKERKLIYDWIDLSKFNIDEINKKDLGFNEDDYIIFTLRGLEKRMGIDLLIKGFCLFNKINKNAKLIIGGRGPEEKNLKALAKATGNKNIIFLGYIPDELVVKYYQMADVFVMPSIDGEGFGLPLIEAMACGTTVLGSNRCAIPEVLDGKKELIIDELDEEGICKSLKKVYDNHGIYSKENLRQYVIDKFSKENFKEDFKIDFKG